MTGPFDRTYDRNREAISAYDYDRQSPPGSEVAEDPDWWDVSPQEIMEIERREEQLRLENQRVND